jgi:hypothetical protein
MAIIKEGNDFFDAIMIMTTAIQMQFDGSDPRIFVGMAGAMLQLYYPDCFSDPQAALEDFDRMTAYTRGEIERIINENNAERKKN